MTETTGVSDSTQKPSGNPETETKTQYEQDKHDGIAYESYKKAVGQYKKANEEIADLKAKLNVINQDKLQAEGKKDELIASLRSQLSELEEKSRSTEQKYTWNVVGAQIKSELAARGVKNPDKALDYARAVNKDDLRAIEVDQDFNVNIQDKQRFVDKFLNDNQDMGFISRVGVKDIPPGKVEITGNENKTLDKMDSEALMNAWRTAE